MSWTEVMGFDRLNSYFMPSGAIFACAYHAVFVSDEVIWNILSWLRSHIVSRIIPLIDPNVQHVNVGVLAKIPICPHILESEVLHTLSREAHDRLREWATGDETATVLLLLGFCRSLML